MRDNDDKALRRQAERIHLQTSSTSVTTNSTTNSANTPENPKMETSNAETMNSTSNTVTPVLNNSNSSNPTVEAAPEPTEPKTNATTEPEKEPKEVKENPEEEDEDEYRGDIGDKLWDDVDKDLGDILREAEPGTKSSDDEDSRYDRFRNSEKTSQLNADKERAEGKDAATEETANAPPKKPEAKSKVEKAEK